MVPSPCCFGVDSSAAPMGAPLKSARNPTESRLHLLFTEVGDLEGKQRDAKRKLPERTRQRTPKTTSIGPT